MENKPFDLISPPPPSDNQKYSEIDTPPAKKESNFQEYAIDPSALQNLKEQAEVSDIESNTALRKTLTEFSMLVTIISLSIWGGVILLHVFGKINGVDIFSDIQFATITTGCTVNILAVIIGVIKGLFNTESKKRKK